METAQNINCQKIARKCYVLVALELLKKSNELPQDLHEHIKRGNEKADELEKIPTNNDEIEDGYVEGIFEECLHEYVNRFMEKYDLYPSEEEYDEDEDKAIKEEEIKKDTLTEIFKKVKPYDNEFVNILITILIDEMLRNDKYKPIRLTKIVANLNELKEGFKMLENVKINLKTIREQIDYETAPWYKIEYNKHEKIWYLIDEKRTPDRFKNELIKVMKARKIESLTLTEAVKILNESGFNDITLRTIKTRLNFKKYDDYELKHNLIVIKQD